MKRKILSTALTLAILTLSALAFSGATRLAHAQLPSSFTSTLYTTPGTSASHGIAVDPDGIVWWTDLATPGAIVRQDPSFAPGDPAGITIYGLPPPLSKPVTDQVDPKGNIWFGTENNFIGKLDPTGPTFTSYGPIPGPGCFPDQLAFDLFGNVWFGCLSTNQIGRLNLPSRTFDIFLTPSGSTKPSGITVDFSGLVWAVERDGNSVVRLDPALASPGTSNGATEYVTPTAVSTPETVTECNNKVWFTELHVFGTGNPPTEIGFLDKASKSITEFTVDAGSGGTYGIVVDGKGNPWATNPLNPVIYGFDASTNTPATFNTPTTPHHIALSDSGELWYSDLSGEVVRLTPDVPLEPSCRANIARDGIPDVVKRFGLHDKDGNLVADFTSSNDIEGNGVPDDFGGPANPCRKAIAVQVDYMSGALDGHTHKPQAAAMMEAVNAFNSAPVSAVASCPYPGFAANDGISLIVDIHNAIPEAAFTSFGSGFETARDANLNPVRGPFFHYSLWVHNLSPTSDGTSGLCCSGKGFIVSLGFWSGETGTVREQSGTFMHELGHTLGLGHGGSDGINYKPNYLSVMNYQFQVVGLTNADTGTSRPDYSQATLPDLDEVSLDEPSGIGNGPLMTSWLDASGSRQFGRGDGPLDWDGNGVATDTGVTVDLNGDGCCPPLANPCVTPGPDGILDTVPAGDDVVRGNIILEGPDRTCDTTAAGDDGQNRPVGDVEPNILKGFDDWSNLKYRAALASTAGAPIVESHVDITLQQARVIEQAWHEFFTLKVTKFFTDSSLNPLPTDSSGNPKVDVVLAGASLQFAVVHSTNPGQIVAFVKVTNTLGATANSVSVKDKLPVDWAVHPAWLPPKGGIQVFFQFFNGATVEITDPKTIIVSAGNPETVLLSIPNIPATAAGKGLDRGDSILLAVKLSYGLVGTSQSATTYPRNYTDVAAVKGYSNVSFTGAARTSSSSSGSFLAFAKLLGDVNGDNKIDIQDAALVAYAYNTRPGDARWNPFADLDNDGVVDINDLAIVALYYGTSL